jgi:NitT/TauT family transport system substrate-binding protein
LSRHNLGVDARRTSGRIAAVAVGVDHRGMRSDSPARRQRLRDLVGTGWSSAGAEKVTVGIGGVALMVYLPTVLAKDKGYFAEEGLDVEILDIKGGGSQAASALIGGSVDFSANAIDHAIKAKTQGKDLVAVHSHVRLPVMGLVVANKYKGVIKSIADLKGHPVGVTSPGSQTHMVLGYLLVKAGVKPTDVQIIGAGGSTMPLAIEKDSVHAGMMVDPFFTVFMKQGKGFALVDMFTTKARSTRWAASCRERPFSRGRTSSPSGRRRCRRW